MQVRVLGELLHHTIRLQGQLAGWGKHHGANVMGALGRIAQE